MKQSSSFVTKPQKHCIALEKHHDTSLLWTQAMPTFSQFVKVILKITMTIGVRRACRDVQASSSPLATWSRQRCFVRYTILLLCDR